MTATAIDRWPGILCRQVRDTAAPHLQAAPVQLDGQPQLSPLRVADRWTIPRDHALWEPIRLRLGPLAREAQVVRYQAPNGHYAWHSDAYARSRRETTVIIQLSDSDSYLGGDLIIRGRGPAPRARGTVIRFPARRMHQVTPVRSGERWTLIVWLERRCPPA